ncbi:EF-hand domain-containing protein [Edaphobacter albus]|uniref:EF-hand domain-containing protein n=1 Tax=Edaphobacter sp. 4G125 TaxID=2763071 RepID=UPI001647367B|nr:EF-hand domain-containing protein [Edaphobacter sp. 4G125]QNI37614.1 EF-hand domain-containing protein [Edaphobacter sp. 4G125]
MHRKYLSLSLLLIVSPALAQGPGAPPLRPAFLALDTNHDGKLSADEIAAASTSLLTLDLDHDGQLTSLEYLPNPADPNANKPDETVQRLMALDRNGDGVLTRDEVPERLQGFFTRADINHDGKLTPDEIRASAAGQTGPKGRVQHSGNATRMDPILDAIDTNHDGILSAEEIAAAPVSLKSLDKDGDGELSSAELRPRQMTPVDRAKHMLDEWDTNKDGKIAKAEAPDRMQQQFESIDTNHDGFLTEDELVVYFTNLPPQQPRREGNSNEASHPQGTRP